MKILLYYYYIIVSHLIFSLLYISSFFYLVSSCNSFSPPQTCHFKHSESLFLLLLQCPHLRIVQHGALSTSVSYICVSVALLRAFERHIVPSACHVTPCQTNSHLHSYLSPPAC